MGILESDDEKDLPEADIEVIDKQPAPPPPPPVDEVVHTVVEGDTLKKIAMVYLADSERWREIYELNQGKLEGQDQLEIGQVLHIPVDS